jgi:hypothetical protein
MSRYDGDGLATKAARSEMLPAGEHVGVGSVSGLTMRCYQPNLWRVSGWRTCLGAFKSSGKR